MNIFSPLDGDVFFVGDLLSCRIEKFSLKMLTVNMTQKCIDYRIVVGGVYLASIKDLCTDTTNYTFRPKAGFVIKYENIVHFLSSETKKQKEQSFSDIEDEGFTVFGSVIQSKRTYEMGEQYSTEIVIRIPFSQFDQKYIQYINENIKKENIEINNRRLIPLDLD